MWPEVISQIYFFSSFLVITWPSNLLISNNMFDYLVSGQLQFFTQCPFLFQLFTFFIKLFSPFRVCVQSYLPFESVLLPPFHTAPILGMKSTLLFSFFLFLIHFYLFFSPWMYIHFQLPPLIYLQVLPREQVGFKYK